MLGTFVFGYETIFNFYSTIQNLISLNLLMVIFSLTKILLYFFLFCIADPHNNIIELTNSIMFVVISSY